MIFVGVLEKPIAQVERGHEIGAVLFHLGDRGIVNVGAVLDRIHSRLGRPENALGAVGVGGHFSSQAMGVGYDGFHLLQRVLGGLRVVAFGKHSASGANLDQIGTVLNVLAHLVLDRGNAVGDSLCRGVIL